MSAIAAAVATNAVAGAAPSRLSQAAHAVSEAFGPQDTFTRGPVGDWEAPPTRAQLQSRMLALREKPVQRDGNYQATELTRTYSSEKTADDNFQRQAEHLLRPGGWGQIGLTYADAPAWTLLDSQGHEDKRNRRMQPGDVLKIDSPSGDFFVKVQDVHADPNSVGFTVRPTSDPANPSGKTDHFFTQEATREFTLTRDGRNVTFNTQGKNETLNLSGWESHGVLDAGRNAATGLGIFALGDSYWGGFADHLLSY